MSNWNFGRFLRIVGAAVISAYTSNYAILASQIQREQASVKRSKQAARARQEYNEQVKDRLEMFEPQADAARTLVLGRVRYVEGVRRRWTSGANEERLTLVVSFAAHEIDGFESWYLDDTLVTLDGSGWVNEAPWAKTVPEERVATGTLDGSGNASITLATAPLGGYPVFATTVIGSGQDMAQGTASVSLSGVTATVTGGTAFANVTVVYTVGVNIKRVRIRPYVGTNAQNVGADLSAEYPGKLNSGSAFAGIALAVVDLLFDPDVFPQGRPNVTAVFRGAKCLDPRTGTTVWSENPALHAYHYARWSSGWALDVADIRTADVIAAANWCDTSTTFTLRKPDTTTSSVTLPRHRSGMTISADADHAAVMNELMAAMAGNHGWAGGIWRMRAGTLTSTAATIDEAWLVQDTSRGRAGDEPVITAVQTVQRGQRYNRVTGSCVDPSQRYQLLPFPALEDSVLVAAKGRRPLEMQLQAVNHIAHAQHLASILIREAQAGLQLEISAGQQAADLELFDVVAVNLAKYGYSAKTFEIVGWEWGQQGPYKLQLAEITSAMYTPVTELVGRDPAPDSDLRAPWDVEQITGVTVTSGTSALLDGSIICRMQVSWTAAVGQNIRQGGQIEVQYAEATGTLPTGEWPSWIEPGNATKAIIPGVLSGRHYLVRVRAIQPPPVMVRGAWSAPVVRHQVSARPTVTTAGLAANAATEVYETSVTAVSVTAASGSGAQNYSGVRWSAVGTIAFTAGLTGNVNLMVTGTVSFSGTPSIYSGALACSITINADFNGNDLPAAGEQLLSDFVIVPQAGSGRVATRLLTTHMQVAVTAGVSYSWPVYAQRLEGTVTIDSMTFRVEQIKR